jgi:hypothetical protein
MNLWNTRHNRREREREWEWEGLRRQSRALSERWIEDCVSAMLLRAPDTTEELWKSKANAFVPVCQAQVKSEDIYLLCHTRRTHAWTSDFSGTSGFTTHNPAPTQLLRKCPVKTGGLRLSVARQTVTGDWTEVGLSSFILFPHSPRRCHASVFQRVQDLRQIQSHNLGGPLTFSLTLIN